MAKINIHIELDTQKDDLSALIAIAEALGGKVTLAPQLPAEEKGEPIKPAAKKTKKAVKTEEPQEPTWEPGGGQVEEEPVKADEATEIVEETNYTVDDVRAAMAEAKRSGKDTADLRAILKNNGAAVVSDLKADKYAAVINAVKAL